MTVCKVWAPGEAESGNVGAGKEGAERALGAERKPLVQDHSGAGDSEAGGPAQGPLLHVPCMQGLLGQ